LGVLHGGQRARQAHVGEVGDAFARLDGEVLPCLAGDCLPGQDEAVPRLAGDALPRLDELSSAVEAALPRVTRAPVYKIGDDLPFSNIGPGFLQSATTLV